VKPRSGPAVSEFAFAATSATPRKRPVQERSQATVTAILDATIRVLGEDGALTTTRVAEVAGVSVGTLYQYFGNREALINGVLADHLETAVAAVEEAAQAVVGLPRVEAGERVVRAFLEAKASRIHVSRALNRAFGPGMLDDRPIVAVASRRAQLAVARLIGDAADPAILSRAGVLCAALEGIVRAAILEDPDRLTDPAWVEQVVAVVTGVLRG
jgi:AcrR family transcriptional regulator